jgi:hypothetical protein
VHEYITFDASGGADDATALTAAQQALALPIRTGELRDEVYALLVRYMTQCEDRVQLWRTWQMFAMAAAIFPASATMHNWLLGVVCHWRPTLGSLDDRRALRKYRRWVVEQLKAARRDALGVGAHAAARRAASSTRRRRSARRRCSAARWRARSRFSASSIRSLAPSCRWC